MDGMSAYFSHTVSNMILEAHGGIVLPILWIVGVQFIDTVQAVMIDNCHSLVNLQFFLQGNCGWHVSILPHGI